MIDIESVEEKRLRTNSSYQSFGSETWQRDFGLRKKTRGGISHRRELESFYYKDCAAVYNAACAAAIHIPSRDHRRDKLMFSERPQTPPRYL